MRKIRRKPVEPPGLDLSNSAFEENPETRFIAGDGPTAGELGITEIVITWGAEKFCPVQYHSLDVGPIQATVSLKPDEFVSTKIRQVHAQLERDGQSLFVSKLEAYLGRVKQTAKITRGE